MDKVSNEEMERIRLANRHRELIDSIEKLSEGIKNIKPVETSTEPIDHIITKIDQAFQKCIDKIEALSKSDPPVIETNQDKVVSSILEMSKEMTSNLSELKTILQDQRTIPLEWEFVFQREMGRYTKITATAVNGK